MVEKKDAAAEMDIKKVLSTKWPAYDVKLSNNDMILYALGVGLNMNKLNTYHFNFKYEHDSEFQAFATMPSVIAHRQSDLVLNIPGFPAFNPMMLLYGEENLEFYKPITSDLNLTVEERIADVADKGKMTALTEESLIKNKDTGETLVKILRSLMIRGVGGYGHKGGAAAVHYPEIPKRAPDAVVESISYPNQALLYRLNGDLNPLHVDPDMAALGGFEKPIIHGLCSSGFTARMVYEKYCNGDPKNLAKFSTRFLSHVFPGETYVVEIWKDGNTLVFQTKTKERGKIAVRGFAELRA